MIKLSQILKSVEENKHSAFFVTPPVYPDAESYLLQSPSRIVTVTNPEEIEDYIDELEGEVIKNKTAVVLLNYECGFWFEKKLNKYSKKNSEVLFTVYIYDERNKQTFKSDEILFDIRGEDSYSINNFKLNTEKQKYIKDIRKIKSYIAAGDTYQVNYTVKGKFEFSGSLSDFFQTLIFNQSAGYASFINQGNKFILSISPELFLKIENGQVTTRPMKGTIKRGYNTETDLAAKNSLMQSSKNKAENVMIVDLLRNDLGRISKFGTVEVQSLFDVEKYESLFQMTSTITAELKTNISLSNLIRNTFPCGSITGAPKIRTMEIIDELESESRGLYTGSIGLLDKNKSVFNVAIRTIEIQKDTGEGEIGLGSGIVWDSEPEFEYNETLLKCNFLLKPDPYFEIIETMLIEDGRISFLKEHLGRLKSACDFFLFVYSNKKIKSVCEQVAQAEKKGKTRFRLRITKWGEVYYDTEKLKENCGSIRIALSEIRTDSENPFLHFKTTNRKIYIDEHSKYSSKGFFDVIFLNQNNNVTEGSISNLLIIKNNIWYTPPVSDGLLNGIYRDYQIVATRTQIKSLTVEDLKNAVALYLTNALRGLMKVDELEFPDGFVKKFQS
ncbi:MAG: aminodeoxychorismate synthase component I [Ignavibacteriales bacterium]|nr:MAG: aminodeoxychorismate synthase component I [Ignavibacteriales bacterium]